MSSSELGAAEFLYVHDKEAVWLHFIGAEISLCGYCRSTVHTYISNIADSEPQCRGGYRRWHEDALLLATDRISGLFRKQYTQGP